MKKSIFFYLVLLWMNNSFGWFNYDRAIIHGQNDKWIESKELLKNELIKKPENAGLLYDAGVSSYKSGEYDKALSYFNKTAQHTNSSKSLQEQAYFNTGNTHVQLKQLQEAIDAYDQALALNPENERAAHNKEVVKKMLEQQKQQEQKQDKKDQQDKNKEKENKENQQQDQNQEQQKDKKEEEQKQQQPSQDQEKQEKESQQNKSQEQQQEQKSSEEKKQQQSKQQQEQEKKEAQEKQQQESQKNDGSAANAEQKQQKENDEQKLSPALARVLENQEKKDAQLNKQMMKAMAGAQAGGSGHDEHYW